uniref:C2H2-type domain-containing protein n=1 Tax=Iridovirus LCIVAC01 TaxID=2506607 RepID=A0A481YQA8_9VIRU|nr:MAG: hypothetical protein LCIVAC01_00380 [Iridovirus LCIVAC01]
MNNSNNSSQKSMSIAEQKCEFCEKIFSTKFNLQRHLQNTKYCLKKRGLQTNKIYCPSCKKILSSKRSLKSHQNICIGKKIKYYEEQNIRNEERIKALEKILENKDEQILKQLKQIEKLEDKLENIAIKAVERPTYQDNRKSNVNQIINNLQPITEEHLKEQVQYLTFDHIKRGIPGYVEYALEYPLKDRIICVDFSRRKIKYKDTDENIITDPEMSKLSQKLFSAIDERNQTLILDYLEQMNKRLFGNIDDEKSEEDHLEDDRIVKEVSRICDYKIGVLKGSRGDLTDFQRDFIKGVCTKVSS